MKKKLLAALLGVTMLFTGCNDKSSVSFAETDSSFSPKIESSESSSKPQSVPDSAPGSAPGSTPDSTPVESGDENSFEVTPPFFRVTDEQTGAEVYMLGSMHVGKQGAFYPQKLYNALDSCETLAVEVDIQALQANIAEMTEATMLMLCPNGTTIKEYLGDDYDGIMAKFKEKGIYNALYEPYIPAMWTSLWTNTLSDQFGYDSEIGTDNLLLTYAKEHGKTVESIETAKEQYQVEADCSPRLQIEMLKETVNLSDEELRGQLDELYSKWSAGDIDGLKALANEESGELDEEMQADYDSYYDAMYTNRQVKMSDYILNKLKSGGKTFVVVGALHYAAAPSILDNLQSAGYKIEKL